MIIFVVLSKHTIRGSDEVVELDDLFYNREDADKRAAQISKGTNRYNDVYCGEVEEREVK